jgi:RHS repeat-associated protein
VAPVRYFDGELSLSATDIAAEGFGFPWGQVRTYSNKAEGHEEGLGSNWFSGSNPYLVEREGGARVAVVHNANDYSWFSYDSGSDSYSPLLGGLSSLAHDSGNSQFKFTDSDGRVTIFNDFDHADRPGELIEFQAKGGNSISVTSTSNGRITEMQRSRTVDGVTTTDSFLYSYGSSGASQDRMEDVIWRQKVDAGSWTNIRRAVYTYHDGTDAFGSLGDLKTAVTQEWDGSAWDELGTSYYRYYKSGDTNGFEHGLRYALNEQAFLNLSDDPNVSDPFTASNAIVSLYADYYFEYDSAQRVVKETVKGGSQTFSFAYSESTHADGFNSWKYKTVETLPDNSSNTVYCNYAGQPMLQVFKSGTDEWLSFVEYDSDGRQTLQAMPSAVSGYDDSFADLNVSLKASDGLIRLTEYYASTGSGGAKGYVKARKIKQGDSGTPVLLSEIEYTSHSAGGITIYPVSKQTTYTNDDGTGAVVTEYSRTYHSGTVQIDQKTTTLPAVPTSQNGSGTADSFVEVYDSDGYLTWRKDERGYITRFKYDVATGAMTQRIDDVDTAQVTDEPTGWSTPSGGGLHLVTDYESDDQGRVTQELGPEHEIDLNGTATNIRTATWTVYKDPQFRTVVGQGYQKTSDSSFTLVNPVRITKWDKNGNALEEIQATRASTSGKLQSTDSFSQSSYTRWTTHQYTDCCLLASTRVYHTIPTSGEGSSGTNYDQTDYGYDDMKRRNRTVTPGGTIIFLVYDERGRIEETWVGTDDTGATQSDPSGGGATGNNMVIVTANQYDGGNAGGDGNLTQETQYVTASDTRVTSFEYDWRDRQTAIDGEIDVYQKSYYDNLNRAIKVERYDTTSSGNLIARSETKFDDLGRVYQTIRYAVDPSDGSVGNSLTDDMWYDASGNVVKQLPAGSKLFTKMVYDGLGRVTKQYTGYDLDETTYSEASTVTSDTILEQIVTTYDEAGNVVETANYQRFHDATGTGALNGPSGSQPKARVSYVAYWADGIGRNAATADYGTNGGSSFTRPATIPARSDNILVTSAEFDNAGNVFKTTDAAGMVVRTTYDDAGRETKQESNYVASPSGSDENVTVSKTYNADGNLATLTAENATTGNQTTTYVYGTTLTDSEIATSTLLRAEEYPDKSSASDRVEFAYNRQSQRTQLTDQNGTVHQYDYDKLGRITQDRVTTVGSGVDDGVRRIATTYEVRGMAENLTSYDNAAVGSGNVLNDVENVYNSFGQLTKQYQEHGGAVNSSTSPKVDYAYADGSSNTIRPTKVTYPDGRELNYSYGTSNGTNDAASRIESLIDDDGTTHLVDYEYLGTGAVVETDYPEPDVRNRLFDPGGSGDIYTSLDRFGRQTNCQWEDYGSSTDAAQIKYGYDRAGNRLWREDVVAAANSKAFDELYSYDGVNRLVDMQRGDLNTGKTAVTNKQFQHDWSLDATGNWSGFKEDSDGDSTWDLNQSRTSNEVNEITDITETAGPSWATPAYDAAGNMTTIPQPASPASSYAGTFDAWNRLVKLVDGSNTVAEYEYDGLKRRIVNKIYSGGTLSETRHAYFSERWQVLEERVDTETAADRHWIWGQRYLDDCVLRDRDTTGNGTMDERLYSLQEGNWNVTALVDDTGTIQERYAYTAYGTPSFFDSSWTSRSSSSYDWETLYAGYYFDLGTELNCVRNRYLHPTFGLWITRDPIKYIVDTNLYQYVVSRPLDLRDPWGLAPEDWNYVTLPGRVVEPKKDGLLTKIGKWQEWLNPFTPYHDQHWVSFKAKLRYRCADGKAEYSSAWIDEWHNWQGIKGVSFGPFGIGDKLQPFTHYKSQDCPDGTAGEKIKATVTVVWSIERKLGIPVGPFGADLPDDIADLIPGLNSETVIGFTQITYIIDCCQDVC